MAASTYDDALRRLLKHEGGYSDHPSDPGGPTNFGITLADVRRYVKPDATAQDVRDLSLAQAKAIYRTRYWDALRCDELPRGVDYAAFDYGVNSGPARAARVLCAIAGRPASSTIDDAALNAIRAGDARALVASLCDERLAFLRRLKTWPVFGTGWSRRVADVRAAALAMAASATPDRSRQAAPQPAGKAIVPINKTAQRTATGGAIAAGTAAAQQAHHNGAAPVVIAAILVCTALLAIAVWLFWRWRQRRRQQTPQFLPLVPAKAGIQSQVTLDSRLRGNERS
jgi:lysozyme family protein